MSSPASSPPHRLISDELWALVEPLIPPQEPVVGLSPAGREAVAVALRMLDAIDAELRPLRKQIAASARRQPGCKALRSLLFEGDRASEPPVTWQAYGSTYTLRS